MTGALFLLAVLVILGYSVALLLTTLDSAPEDENPPSWPSERPMGGDR